MGVVIGWDIGGVHLKAVRAEDGRIVKVAQYASPLRSGTGPLEDAFAQARKDMGHGGHGDRNVITMTGELADIFASRQDGVEQLSSLAQRELENVSIYAGPSGFVAASEVRRHSSEIASANWYASATVIAKRRKAALFLDVGSTTTDVVPIADHKIAARGYTDAQRLAMGELVYTGLVRSFVMATAARAPLSGAWTTLINENFATMADVQRILGTLPKGVDLMPTADGREKSIPASRARLARMLGSDAANADARDWDLLARWFAEAQIRAITDATMLVVSSCVAASAAPIIAAGIGLDVVAEVARRLGLSCERFDEFLEVVPEARNAVCHCAPAAALTALASQWSSV
jgi:(4-(4-[2-(gamma-L-glutamylamino)ethyl]phenoxymethyl)furan-2-yl)methanamine synthase